jgi:CheY-like chemotaxis protein
MLVLVIDDDVAVRAVLRDLLEMAGFEVVEASDGAEGIRTFRRQRADLIFCDVFMPERDGLETITELRRDFPGVKVIAMSGGGFGGSLDLLPVARALGAAAVLHKPFGRAAVLAAVERALGASAGDAGPAHPAPAALLS